jgi:hypothetical protein
VTAVEDQDPENEYGAIRLMRNHQNLQLRAPTYQRPGTRSLLPRRWCLADPGRVGPRQSRTIAASRFLDRPTVM